MTGLPNHQNGMYGLNHLPNHFDSFSNVKSLPAMLKPHNIRTGKFSLSSTHTIQTLPSGKFKRIWSNGQSSGPDPNNGGRYCFQFVSSHPGGGGTPIWLVGTGYLHLAERSDTPPPPARTRWGYPSCKEHQRSTLYTAGGMPLAFTQEDFLVLKNNHTFHEQTKCTKVFLSKLNTDVSTSPSIHMLLHRVMFSHSCGICVTQVGSMPHRYLLSINYF